MRIIPMFASIAVAWTLVACQDPSGATIAEPAPELEIAAVTASLPGGTTYHVTPLPSLGGNRSQGSSITSRGWLAGLSHDPGDATQQAAVWRNGELTPLGTLGGPSSSVVWHGQNARGTVVGISETADLDPEGENFSCFFFFPSFPEHSGHICRGFAWDGGAMRELPTLGGHNSFATGVNNRGQIVGWAENTVRDPTCIPDFQVLQFRAVIWGPKDGAIEELPPLPGDSVSAATAINQRGQVVGISGDCDQAVGRFSARHAVLWDRGETIDLSNLGGMAWNTPMYISDRGDVVGFAGPPPDAESTALLAFFWSEEGGMEEINPVAGCTGTHQAQAVNSRRQVVGVASGCSDDRNRAFLWEDGVTRDLNDLVGPDTEHFLVNATEINDRGQITGAALDPETDALVAFIATPGPVRGPQP